MRNEAFEEFARLVREVQAGSQDAAWTLIEEYGPHIRRVARRNLDPRLQSKFDASDFVQSVWASFFVRPAVLQQFTQPEQLIGYLARMARNKVIDANRQRLDRQKNDVRRERSIEQDPKIAENALIAKDPTASQVAIARDQWERIIRSQPPRYREVVQMRFDGATQGEIARSLKIHERTVRKIIKQVFDEWDS